MNTTLNRSLFLVLLAASLMTAQTFVKISPTATFDVVSVKQITDPATLQAIKSGEIKYAGGNLYMHGVTVGYAIQWAYDIQPYQLSGPDWISWRPSNDMPRYDILAKADPATSKAAARVMAQAVLVERFGLTFHYEDKIRQTYVLRDDPKGLKVERIEDPADTNSVMTFVNNKLDLRFMTMKDLGGDLALTLKDPVVDRTSLGGQKFNASAMVFYEPGKGEMIGAIFGALRKEMGIGMTVEKLPTKTFTVDKINVSPTAN
jgi:uncharacterized protein (TIGR03435 family)